MPKVHISPHSLNDHTLMLRIIDAGYTLTNQTYHPTHDHYTFDIEGPDVPQCETVNILLSDDGRVWCEKQKIITFNTDELDRHIDQLLKFVQSRKNAGK